MKIQTIKIHAKWLIWAKINGNIPNPREMERARMKPKRLSAAKCQNKSHSVGGRIVSGHEKAQ